MGLQEGEHLNPAVREEEEEETMGDDGRECTRATVEGREAVRKSTSQQAPAFWQGCYVNQRE